MKRLIIKTLLLIVIPITIVNVTILSMKDDYSLHSNEINAALAYHRLDSLKNDNKIIIIAGSNGSWGINSKMLSDTFHLPVVNTSTHGGIGVRMQFEIYKKFMKENDIVIFCPEYYSGPSTLYGESTLLRIVSTYFPQEYLHFSLKQWIHVYKYIGIHLKECIEHRGTKAADGPYSDKAVNKYGDIDCKRPHGMVTVAYCFQGTLDADALDYYKSVFSFAEERGVRLIYLPPTLMERNYLDQEKQIDSLAFFMKNNGIPYQVNTKRYMFPDSLYCNTPYHMTAEGAIVRTEKLIEDMTQISRNYYDIR